MGPNQSKDGKGKGGASKQLVSTEKQGAKELK